MAYTIISQNNTTTTLADENGNVITVPARVTLATSTDYTIIKVNNNSVDLESGDGKIIRGVPACVVLAGEGGGSGESYLPLTGGTLTGNLKMSDSKVQLHNTSYTFSYWLDAYLSGHLRIGKSSSVDTGDLFISTGSGGDKIIAFGESGGSVGSVNAKLERVYTQKLNNGADIAVPTMGGTMAVIGVNTTATLAVADWSSSTQTVSVTGVAADSVVFVSPAPASASDYASAGILCTAQAADSLTFTCTTTPTNAITVNVICM